MASISLQSIEKHYGKQHVLHDCNLEITDHEFMVIVGPSGSGKTTLLRIIAGLETVTEGRVYFGETLVNDVDVGDRNIAMVFQNYGLYPHMSVFDNMAFGLRRRHLTRPQIEARVREAASMLGISDLLQRRPRQLSGGQRQRVALGRAMVREPTVFLLDEPLSNLDAHLRVQMRAEILRLHRAVSATAVYVTHDQVEAMTMGDRIVVMDEGRVQQVGPPEELYDHPCNRFVAGFIGTPAMGFLSGILRRNGDGAWVEGSGFRVEVPAQRARQLDLPGDSGVVVGIRPEHLRAVSEGLAGSRDASRIEGLVDVVEPLGSDMHVHVAVGTEKLTARLPRDRSIQPEQRIAFAVDGSQVHLFDPDSGAACP